MNPITVVEYLWSLRSNPLLLLIAIAILYKFIRLVYSTSLAMIKGFEKRESYFFKKGDNKWDILYKSAFWVAVIGFIYLIPRLIRDFAELFSIK